MALLEKLTKMKQHSVVIKTIFDVFFISAMSLRDGERIRPGRIPIRNDVLTVMAGIAVFVAVLFAHPLLASQ